MFSGWVGDDNPNFDGLRSAITKLLLSAEALYANFGSDIGGYRTQDDLPLGRTREAFTRWFQMATFIPLMENGGNGEHRPWIFDDPGSTEVVDLYRKFVNAHYELVPYLLDIGTNAWETVTSSLTPVKKVDLVGVITTDFDFYLGTEILVCPMVYNDTIRNITFPGNSSITYTNYFDPRDVHHGNTTVIYPCDWDRFPVFVISGGILPLRIVHGEQTNRGSSFFPHALTILLNRPQTHGGWVTKQIREFGIGRGLKIGYSFHPFHSLSFSSSAFHPVNAKKVKRNPEHAEYDQIIFSVEGVCFDYVELLHVVQKVELNHQMINQTLAFSDSLERLTTSSGFFHDRDNQRLYVVPSSSQNGVEVSVIHSSPNPCSF